MLRNKSPVQTPNKSPYNSNNRSYQQQNQIQDFDLNSSQEQEQTDYSSSFCYYHKQEKMQYICFNPDCQQQYVFCKKCVEKNHPHHKTLRIDDLFLKLNSKISNILKHSSIEKDAEYAMQLSFEMEQDFEMKSQKLSETFDRNLDVLNQRIKQFVENKEFQLDILQHGKAHQYLKLVDKIGNFDQAIQKEKLIEVNKVFEYCKQIELTYKNKEILSEKIIQMKKEMNQVMREFAEDQTKIFKRQKQRIEQVIKSIETIEPELPKTFLGLQSQTQKKDISKKIGPKLRERIQEDEVFEFPLHQKSINYSRIDNIQKNKFDQVEFNRQQINQIQLDYAENDEENEQDVRKIIPKSLNKQQQNDDQMNEHQQIELSSKTRLKYNFEQEALKDQHNDIILSCAFSTNGRYFATAGNDKQIRVYFTKNSQYIKSLVGHSSFIHMIKFFHDDSMIVSCSNDRTVRFWDIKSGDCVHSKLAHSDTIFCLDLTHNNQYLLTGSWDKQIKLWEIEQNELVKCFTLSDHVEAVNYVVFSPDNQKFATVSNDYTIQIWDTKQLLCLKAFKNIHNNGWQTQLVSFSVDDQHLAVAGPDENITILNYYQNINYNNQKMDQIIVHAHKSKTLCVLYTSFGNQLISGDQSGEIKVWNVKNLKCQYKLKGHTDVITSLQLNDDESKLLSTSFDKQIRVWHFQTIEENDQREAME